MAIHFLPTPLLAMLGVLALGGASAARAQDTSAAARTDTSGYQQYENRTDSTQAGKDTTSTDSSGFKYTGPSTDTTLKAAPGAQTGPSTDSSRAAAPSGMNAADSVVCKDGSNEGNRGGVSCGAHGGIDSVTTTAAMKARGWLGKSDSSAATDTSSSSQKQSP